MQKMRYPLVGFLLSLLIAQGAMADAATNFVLNKTNYFSNDPIILELGALSLDSSDVVGPVSNVFIIPAGLTLDGSTFLPALDPSGVPNVIFGLSGGGFFGETIGFTRPAGSVGAGTWDIVEDTNQNNIFDLGDSVLRNAFTVNLSTNVPPIMSAQQIAAIKLRAAQSRGQLESAKAFLDGSKFAAGAVSAGFENGIEAAIEFARDELVSEFLPCRSIAECALGYAQGLLPETPIEWGYRVIDDLVEDMVGRYAGIAADPPDPDFQQVTNLTVRVPVYSGGSDPFDLPSANMVRAFQDEAATAAAFLHAMERYQGADAAGNGDWALLHARQLRDYALLLAENLSTSNTALADFVGVLNADSRDLDGRVASYQDFVTALQTTGYSVAQLQGLANLGYTQQQRDELLQEIAALDLSTWSKAGLIASFAAIQSNNDAAIPELNALAVFLEGVINTLVADPLVADNFPVVDAGGPYFADELSLLQLDASGSTPGSGASSITAYAWDLDADGEFDDAVGVSPSVSFNSKHSGVIALQVSNDEGQMNIGYASVAVTDSNPSPEIVSFTTPELQPNVEVGDNQQFTVDASDNGAVTIEWRLDGLLVGTGSSFDYMPSLPEVGLHHLVVRIDDGTSSGGVVEQRWTVVVLEPDGDTDGYTLVGGDCNDANAAVNPGMSEVVDNGLDDDCNPATEDADQPPVANFITFPLFAADGEPIELLNRSTDPNGDITSYEWDFGDGSAVSNASETSHTFAHRGIFFVTLTVTDEQGNSDSLTLPVEVLGTVSVEIMSNPAPENQPALGHLGNDHIIGSTDISDDGLWILFTSKASNLIPIDINAGRVDAFVKNTQTGAIILISKHSDGTQARVPPGAGSIFILTRGSAMSSDGRYVVFSSTAKNLVGIDADDNGMCDDCDSPHLYSIFVHDRDADGNGTYDEPGGFTTREIIGGTDAFGMISDDGRTLVFQTDIRDLDYVGSEGENLPGGNIQTSYVFTEDLVTGVRRLITREIDGSPTSGSLLLSGGVGTEAKNPISADGSHVVFTAPNANIVGIDTDNDGNCDVDCNAVGSIGLYVWSDAAGTVNMVNRNRLGVSAFGASQNPSSVDMSADGRFIAFVSGAQGLILDSADEVVDTALGGSAKNKNYLLDRDTDGNGIFDEPGGYDVEYISIRVGNSPTDPLENLAGRSAEVSDDGRFVLFQGAYGALIGPPEFASTSSAFGPVLRDRLANRNTVPFYDIFGIHPGQLPVLRMSRDGRYIVPVSLDTNWIGTDLNGNGRCRAFPDGELDCDSNGKVDLFLVDRDADDDGKFAEEDLCANSLPNAQVDELGCPLGFGISISVQPQAPKVALNGSAEFEVFVVNTGESDLFDLDISDPLLPDCDNFIAVLAAAESVDYLCSQSPLSGPLTHTATVSGATSAGETVTASGSASVLVATPAIEIVHTPDPKNIGEGLDYVLQVSVTNVGDIDLQNIAVDATTLDACDRMVDDLGPGESASYSCLAQGTTQSFTSVVDVTGEPASGDAVSASASLEVFVIPDDLEPPPAPVYVDSRAKTDQALVFWLVNKSASYNVYRSAAGGEFEFHGNSELTFWIFGVLVDNTVDNGTQYCYFVRAVNAGGAESENSATTCATPAARFRDRWQ